MYLVFACHISIYRKVSAMTVLRKCYLIIDHEMWYASRRQGLMLPGLLNDKRQTVQEMLPYTVAGHLNDINTFHAEGQLQ